MTQENLKDILVSTGYPVAYLAFPKDKVPEMPFIVYQDIGSQNIGADDRVFYPVTRMQIDLITEFHDTDAETALETALNKNSLFWERVPNYDYSENYYRATYEVTIGG